MLIVIGTELVLITISIYNYHMGTKIWRITMMCKSRLIQMVSNSGSDLVLISMQLTVNF